MRSLQIALISDAGMRIVFTLMFATLLFPSPTCAEQTSILFDTAHFAGADSTGESDNTQALQTAINAAAGKELILPSGVYKLTSVILPVEGVRLLGKGAKFRLAPFAADGIPTLRLPPNASHIEIDGLEIDGGSQGSSDIRRITAIKSSGEASHIKLSHLFIHDIPLSGVEIADGDFDWKIADNRIDHVGRHGVAVDFLRKQVHDLQITENTISNCGFSPIMIVAAGNVGSANNPDEIASAGAVNVTISHNRVGHNGLDIAGYSPNNRNITVLQNIIDDNGLQDKMGHAIHFGGSNIIIKGNVARNSAISAIVVSAWPNSNPTSMQGFEISDNVIAGVRSAKNSKGILVQNASAGSIYGNRISGTRECPIEVEGSALKQGGPHIHDITISGNTIADNRAMGRDGVCVKNADNVISK